MYSRAWNSTRDIGIIFIHSSFSITDYGLVTIVLSHNPIPAFMVGIPLHIQGQVCCWCLQSHTFWRVFCLPKVVWKLVTLYSWYHQRISVEKFAKSVMLKFKVCKLKTFMRISFIAWIYLMQLCEKQVLKWMKKIIICKCKSDQKEQQNGWK